jgi:D-arginine dehydrogenase
MARFAIIGAGMAGASIAYELASTAETVLIEREAFPGYHTTGRSAALYSETYGNAPIRRLTSGARRFFLEPPAGFAEHPLLTPLGCLFVARADQEASLAAHMDGSDQIRLIEPAEALRMVPALRSDYVAGAAYEPGAMEIDVHALHQGFLKGARARGARLLCDAGVERIERKQGGWEIATAAGIVTADIIVNAAGAWAEAIGAMAGAAPIGLTPLRRTALIIDPPPGLDPAGWAMVIDVDEAFYFKPDAGRILASPADETPSPPCDAQPEELDIALCIDRIQQAADLPVRRVIRAWAGLRSFVADRTPVVGFDPKIAGFFWLAGQGGYGIQTAPSLARLAASLARGEPVPEDLVGFGIDPAALAPERPGLISG